MPTMSVMAITHPHQGVRLSQPRTVAIAVVSRTRVTYRSDRAIFRPDGRATPARGDSSCANCSCMLPDPCLCAFDGTVSHHPGRVEHLCPQQGQAADAAPALTTVDRVAGTGS